MVDSIRIGKYEIKNFGEPVIIAEIGSNHNGNIKLAKKLIDKAKECGAHCVKFQSFDTNLYSKVCYTDSEKKKKVMEDSALNNLFKKVHKNLKKELEDNGVTKEQLKEIKQYCDKKDIMFCCTPLNYESVDFLADELDVKFIKIASMELNNPTFLEYAAKKNKPIALSTGMGTIEEVEAAIKTIKDAGNNQIVLFHCVSIYPPDDEIVNLNNMLMLREKFNLPTGFSDHTFGTSIPLAAVAMGACMIEKHFTLDKGMEGWDHSISANPKELKIIVQESKKIHTALGKRERVVCQKELDQRTLFRRSIIVTKDLPAGHILAREDLEFKRPGVGIEPNKINEIVGKELKNSLDQDDLLYWEDLK